MKSAISALLLLASATTLRCETIWIQQEKRICGQIFTATRVLEFDGTEYTYLGGNIDKDIDCLFTASTTYERTEQIVPAIFPNAAVFKTHTLMETSSWTSDNFIVDVTSIDIRRSRNSWFVYIFSRDQSVSAEFDAAFTREDGSEFAIDTLQPTGDVLTHISRWMLEDGTGVVLQNPRDDLWIDVLLGFDNAVTIPDSSFPGGEWSIRPRRFSVPFAVVGPLLDVLPDPDRIIRYNIPEPNSVLPLLFCLFLKRLQKLH